MVLEITFVVAERYKGEGKEKGRKEGLTKKNQERKWALF